MSNRLSTGADLTKCHLTKGQNDYSMCRNDQVLNSPEIPLPSDDFLFDLLEPWDVRALSIGKTADLPLQLWVGTFPRFVAIRFYFLSETLIWIISPIIFLFIHNHLTLKKWCYSITARFSLRPYHFDIWLSLSSLQTWSCDTNWMMTATHCMGAT
jgi:hypothetical protein